MKFSAEAGSDSPVGPIGFASIIGFRSASTAPLFRNTTARAVPERVVAAAHPPTDWIFFDDFNLTPVLDEVSRRLHLASTALGEGDDISAACELHAVAAELRRGSIKAAGRAGAAACVDVDLAQIASWRLASGAAKLSVVARALENGRDSRKIELTALIDGTTCADIERRWLVTDEDIWYPVCGEPQRHLGGAMQAYERQDRKTTVTEIQKAAGYLRLEAGRATDYAKRALVGAVAGLGKLTLSVALARIGEGKSIPHHFAAANLALALAHRVKSSEWWTRGDRRLSGYELKAASRCLEDAAAWVGNAVAASASRAARDAKALAERLVYGEGPEGDEAIQGLLTFAFAVDALGRKINTQ